MMPKRERQEPSAPRYDVFLSFAGPDRWLARGLMRELRRRGLRVFVDDMIDEFEGIDEGIALALAGSKTFVAIYSREFAARPACQRELTAAFIAGQRRGSPADRILVINPEPTADHVQPIELADAKYAVPPDDTAALGDLAAKIRARVGVVSGALGDAVSREFPPWFGALPGSDRFVGRHRDLWVLHSALRRSDFGLAHTASCGPIVSVCGLPGAGKSALVAAYAWQFGNGYPGGVFWHRPGGDASDGAGDYRDSLRSAAIAAGLDPPGGTIDHGRLVAALGEELRRRGRPVLWVVDDVPETFDPIELTGVIPPAGHLLRTVLISRENIFDSAVPVLELGTLPAHDAKALLGTYRTLADVREVRAANRLVEQLGGHCGALCAVGRQLRDANGLISVADYEAAVGDGKVRAAAALHPTLQRLTADEKAVIRLAAVSGSDALPAELVAAVLGDAWRTAAAFAGIRRKLLASRNESWWTFHPLATAELARSAGPGDADLASRLVAELLRLATAQAATPAVLDGLRSIAGRLLVARVDLLLSEERRLLALLTSRSRSAQGSTEWVTPLERVPWISAGRCG